MKKKVLLYLFLGCSLMTIFSSCRKQSFGGIESPSAGKTFVWFDGAPVKSQFFDVFTDVKPVNMVIIRRDAANNGDLKKAVTISIKTLGQTYLDGLGSGYTDIFPSELYTMPSDADIASGGQYTGSQGITKTADGFTVNFAAGEFAKNLWFKVDGSKLDLSKQYGVAFAMTSFGGFSKKVGYDTVVSSIAIKNKYDGVYSYTGTIHRDADVTLGGPIAAGLTVNVATVSANADEINALWADGSGQIGGVNPIRLTVDPATNKVTVTSAANGTLMNIPGSDNSYDPATKTFNLSFVWNGTDPAHRSATLQLVYSGPR